MVSRAHRWPGDDTPLSNFHGGTAKAARFAVKVTAEPVPAVRASPKRAVEREQAVAVARAYLEQLLSKLPPVTKPVRMDRVRPRVTTVSREDRRVWVKAHVAAQKDRCHYCAALMAKRPIDAERWRRPTLDHVVPLCAGGDDSFENTVAACLGCNQAKGALSVEEFLPNMRSLRAKMGFV